MANRRGFLNATTFAAMLLLCMASCAQGEDKNDPFDGGFVSVRRIGDYVYRTEDGVAILNTSTLQGALENVSPWFIAFTSPWCGHCKRLAPTWAEVARDFEGKVALAKVDATLDQALAAKFDIKGYPTLFHISKDLAVRKYTGPRSAYAFAQFLDGGFEKVAPLGPLENPLGVMGSFKGKVVEAGHAATNIYRYMTNPNHLGLSPGFAVAILCSAGFLLTLLLGVLAAKIMGPM